MKIHKDCYVAIFLFLFCALGLYGITSTETPMAEELIGPLALSWLSIIGIALCACFILFYSKIPKKEKQENIKASVKTLFFTLLFAIYLFSMVFIGEYIQSNAVLNITYGGGFFIASTLFATCAMYILGQRNIFKILLLSLCIVSSLLLVFGHFFYVLLP